jgi:hypothetical protein
MIPKILIRLNTPNRMQKNIGRKKLRKEAKKRSFLNFGNCSGMCPNATKSDLVRPAKGYESL